MKHWYNKDDCEHLRAYHAYYSVPVAAMLWCGVPPNEIQEELTRTSQHPNIRGVYTHPFIPCLEVRCRIIHDAIESGVLSASRENGKTTDDHIAPERRHVSRENLKAWIAKNHPGDKPAFLFDEIERDTRPEISAESYRSMKAAHDAKEQKLNQANERIRELEAAKGLAESERDALRGMVEKMSNPGDRAEGTYLNIIGAMLELMRGSSPAGQRYSVFDSQTAIISAILGHYEGKPGISERTLQEKFASANRNLNGS